MPVPVGSQALVGALGLRASWATVRSAMSQAGALGASGRRPRSAWAIEACESLMRESNPSIAPDQLMIRHQFHQVQLTSDDWPPLVATGGPTRPRRHARSGAPRPIRPRRVSSP